MATNNAKDPIFSVRHNGIDVAIGITRDAASAILDAPDRARGFWQVYLMAKPLEGRKPAWRKQPIPRMPSLSCGEKERAKLLAALDAAGIHTIDETPAVASNSRVANGEWRAS